MAAPHRTTILVVDDEQDTCENLRDILSDLGYQVDTALDGYAALELVKQKPYDLALLDLRMPGMDGLALYRQIRKVQSGTVAIIVTAYAEGDTANAALDAGAWKIVPKPVDFHKLLTFIDEAVDQPVVLVVDDDPELCDNLWDLLRERSFRVCVAHDLVDVERKLKAREFDVVLIDMKLPQSSGGQVFRLVRDANPKAKTILITGFGSELNREVDQVLREGANAVCLKPFDVPQLLRTLDRLAGRETPAA